jgi:hypothetical protein
MCRKRHAGLNKLREIFVFDQGNRYETGWRNEAGEALMGSFLKYLQTKYGVEGDKFHIAGCRGGGPSRSGAVDWTRKNFTISRHRIDDEQTVGKMIDNDDHPAAVDGDSFRPIALKIGASADVGTRRIAGNNGTIGGMAAS